MIPRNHWLITTHVPTQRTTGMSIDHACGHLQAAIVLRQLNRVGVSIEDENGTRFWLRDKKPKPLARSPQELQDRMPI